MGSGTGALNPNKPNRKNKKVEVTSDADRRKPDKEVTTNPDTRAKEQAKSDIGPSFRKGSYSTDNVSVDPNLDPLKADIKNKPPVKDDGTRTVGGRVRTYKIGDTPPEGRVARAQRLKREAEAAKNKPKVKVSQALKTAERPVIKGGPSVKRGDPIPQKVKPVKKKPVPEIGGYQFNTFKDSEIKKRKTFKQVFGRPTGADPKTGKPTYVAPGVVTGKPRKSLPRSKDLPDYDTVKKEINQRGSEKIIKQNQKVFDQMFKDNGGVRKRKPSEKPVIEDPFVKRKSKKSKQTPQPENVKFVGGDKVTGDVESNFVGPKRARSKTATQNRVLQKIRVASRKTKRPVQRLVKPSGSALAKTAKFAGKNPFATLVGASMAKDSFFPAALPQPPKVQGGKVGRRTAG